MRIKETKTIVIKEARAKSQKITQMIYYSELMRTLWWRTHLTLGLDKLAGVTMKII